MGRTEGNPQEISSRLHQHYSQSAVGDGVTVEFFLTKTLGRLADLTVTVAGAQKKVSDRGVAFDYSVRGLTPGYNGSANAVKFAAAPANAAVIIFSVVST